MVSINTAYPCNKSNYTSGRKQNVRYVVIHYVGATGSALQNVKYFHNNYAGASAHYFVGHASEKGQIYQSVAEYNTAWHCGATAYIHKECRNANSIGIELCCHVSNGVWYFDKETVDAAVELTKDIMKRYNIPVENVVRHFDVTGKACPKPFVSDLAAWRDFKARLVAPENNETTEQGDDDVLTYEKLGDVPSSYKPAIQHLMEKGALVGYSNPDPNSLEDNVLNVSEDYCRVMTTLYNLGLLD